MKVNVNLARAQGFRQRHLVAWSVPVLAVAGLLLLRMIVGVQANWREYRAVGGAADREAARQNDLLVREAALHRKLDEPDNRALLREVQFINQLIDERRLAFDELTDKVTAMLPPQARLSGLSMPDASGEPLVHFMIEGASEEPVETFLTNLENSPDFRDVVITNQGFEEQDSGAGAKAGAPVSITCSARYVGRIDLALLSGKTAVPAGEKVLDAPAPKVTTGAKPATGLGIAASTKSAGSQGPLLPGRTPARAPVGPPPAAPAVRNPAAQPSSPNPGTVLPGSRHPSSGQASTPPKTN
ncbi:MAG TPA: hypothetical protein VGZ29_09585 [Terriglobia bacterium]|nr:hypothetical protein [Terriglobia bacterium]